MVTRNKSVPSAQTQTAKAVEDVITPTTELGNDENFSMLDMVRIIGASLGVVIPSGKQMIASSVTMVIVTALGAYSGLQIAAYVAVGAVMLTGSVFIAYLLSMIVALVAFYSALIAASRAASYVASGQLESDVVRVKNYFTGFFKKAEPAIKSGASA